MTKRKTTEMMLAEMLTENTGRHFLDSGGAYGRNWEHNQGMTVEAFMARPAATFNKWGFTLDVFHFLLNALDYDAKLDVKFQRFLKRKDEKEKYWLESIENYLDYLRSKGIVSEPFGDGLYTVNTYNGEDALSQTIQYTMFEYSGDENEYLPNGIYTILQIHGGCDVRGGYTIPRLFMNKYAESLTNNADGYISCEGLPTGIPENQLTVDGSPAITWTDTHAWYTDDAYNWYDEGTYSNSLHLDDFPEDEESDSLLCPKCGAKMVAQYY